MEKVAQIFLGYIGEFRRNKFRDENSYDFLNSNNKSLILEDKEIRYSFTKYNISKLSCTYSGIFFTIGFSNIMGTI